MDKMKEKLNIVMFGHKHIPSREGGVEIVVQELSTRMAKRGHRITCYNRGGKALGYSQEALNDIKNIDDLKIRKVPTINKKGLAAVTSSFFAAVRTLFTRADVVHIHAEGPAFMSFLPKLAGKKVIVTIHGLDWQREKWKSGFASDYIRKGEKMAVKYADEIIVLSESVRRYFEEKYSRKTHFISNGVSRPDLYKADLIKRDFGLAKNDYILFLGRLVPEKGVHLLIDAFRKVDTDKKLVIAGATSDTDDYVKELMDSAKDDKRIIFTGFVQGLLLEELFSNAYIYTLPSSLEGMPLSLLEAMSYSNACLVSDIPECSEVVEDKAEIFTANDAENLREKLQKLCDDTTLVSRYKSQAADFICRKYNWNDVVEKTLSLYQES